MIAYFGCGTMIENNRKSRNRNETTKWRPLKTDII